MGVWGWFTDNVLGIDPPGPTEEQKWQQQRQTELLAEQTAMAKQSADAALKAQREANLTAAAASVSPSDSESARSASDNRRRRLMMGSSFGIGLPSQLGAPPVGFRLLSGQ